MSCLKYIFVDKGFQKAPSFKKIKYFCTGDCGDWKRLISASTLNSFQLKLCCGIMMPWSPYKPQYKAQQSDKLNISDIF